MTRRVDRILACLAVVGILMLAGCSSVFVSRRAPVASSPTSLVATAPRAAQVTSQPEAAPKLVKAPSVVGSDVADAEKALRKAGLDFAVGWVSGSGVAQRGVISQTPSAGARVRAGSRVDLRVSLGAGATGAGGAASSSGGTAASIDKSLLPGHWTATSSGATFSDIDYVGSGTMSAVSFGDNLGWNASITVSGQTLTVSVSAKKLTVYGRITKLTSTALAVEGIGSYRKTGPP